MNHALTAAAALSLLATGTAAAADASGRFAIKGVGLARCSEFNAAVAQRSPQLGQYLSWIAGYLTAANRYEPRTYDLVTWQDELYLLGSMQRYCAANPGTQLIGMVRAMVRSLGPGRLASASPSQTMVVGGRTISLYSAVIVGAKERLTKRGFYRGPLGPTPDAAFISALAAFQQAEKLPATGVPDQDTLFRLFSR